MEEKTRNRLAAIGCVLLPPWSLKVYAENVNLAVVLTLLSVIPILAVMKFKLYYPEFDSRWWTILVFIGTSGFLCVLSLLIATLSNASYVLPIAMVIIPYSLLMYLGVWVSRFLWRQ
jgi:membrane-bound acyltransferase YfiQ involved in biofilm formation